MDKAKKLPAHWKVNIVCKKKKLLVRGGQLQYRKGAVKIINPVVHQPGLFTYQPLPLVKLQQQCKKKIGVPTAGCWIPRDWGQALMTG